MVKLILIRPGCTEYDQQQRIAGRLNIPLCDDGRRQAIEAADALREFAPKAIYHSPSQSSRETAELLAARLQLKAKEVDELENLDQGLWQGMQVDEIRHKQPRVFKQWQEHPENVCAPRGETLALATERVEEALERLARRHRGGAIVLVAPEPLSSIIRHRLAGNSLGDLWRADNRCDRIDVLELERNLPVLQPATTLNGRTNGHASGISGVLNLTHEVAARQ